MFPNTLTHDKDKGVSEVTQRDWETQSRRHFRRFSRLITFAA